jgi:hypothetical protein
MLRHGLPIPGMLPWSMPGIDGIGFFGAGVAAGFGAGFGAGAVAGFFVEACAGFGVEPRRLDAEDDLGVGRDVVLGAAGVASRRAACDGIAMPGMAPVPIVVPSAEGTRASMSRSTGSVIARSRITGSAIIRAWIANTSADTLSEDGELAIADMPVPVIPMAEWSIPGMLPMLLMGMLPVLLVGMLAMLPMEWAPSAVFVIALFASGPQTMVSDLASVTEA